MIKKLPPLTPVICAYPECSNMVWITVKQKRELIINNYLKYGDLSAGICCSQECQQKLLNELSQSKFLTTGNVKNRERALIVEGADVLKRPKEEEVLIITGTKTQQRTSCIVNKLLSMKERKIKLYNEKTPLKLKYLDNKEIQDYLLMGINADLRVKPDRIQVTASEIMSNSKAMFPDVVSLELYNQKDRVLISIK